MSFGLDRKMAVIIALIALCIATVLWFLGVIPWWAILISVPVVTVAGLGLLFVLGILSWMAGGSH